MQTRIARIGRRRAGISLLEVVFSIGVVLIGLVGIAALLPLAGVQANKGGIADRAARTGRAAVRDFQVRGMNRPQNWRWFNPAASPARFVQFTPARGQSFCIDPLFIGLAPTPAERALRNKFPYNVMYDTAPPANRILWMPRLTLAPSHTATAAQWMGYLQAKEIFVSHDPLVFELPKDRTLGPVQLFDNGTDKREIGGKLISWMATVVPKLDRFGVPTDQYVLSIVVFSQRVMERRIGSEDEASERVVFAAEFYSGAPALSGGDMTLVTRAGRPAADLELRQGQWVMLSGEKLVLSRPPRTVQVHKWYRVVATEEDPRLGAGGRFYRSVTLVGPDWDWRNMRRRFPRPAPSSGPLTTQVTIPSGVVAVFEKTIRLETSSLWAP